ncbi:MAG: hypothetical protein RL033_7995, partial [Pseudomonadota bacterium]
MSVAPAELSAFLAPPLAELREHSHSYAAAQVYLRRSPADAWVAYVAGVLVALQLELDPVGLHGLSIDAARGITDPITSVRPGARYRVRAAPLRWQCSGRPTPERQWRRWRRAT